MARRKAPKALTPALLEQAALDYLARYAASARGVRQVLARRINRVARQLPDTNVAEANAWADVLIARLKQKKLLDDEAFAALKVRSLSRSGRSGARIAQTLAAKGVGRETAAEAIAHHKAENPDAEFKAALAYAKRRRLGPFGQPKRGEPPDVRLRRELGSFARQGFKAEIALKILKTANMAIDDEDLADDQNGD